MLLTLTNYSKFASRRSFELVYAAPKTAYGGNESLLDCIFCKYIGTWEGAILCLNKIRSGRSSLSNSRMCKVSKPDGFRLSRMVVLVELRCFLHTAADGAPSGLDVQGLVQTSIATNSSLTLPSFYIEIKFLSCPLAQA